MTSLGMLELKTPWSYKRVQSTTPSCVAEPLATPRANGFLLSFCCAQSVDEAGNKAVAMVNFFKSERLSMSMLIVFQSFVFLRQQVIDEWYLEVHFKPMSIRLPLEERRLLSCFAGEPMEAIQNF